MGKIARALGITALLGALAAGGYAGYKWYNAKPPRLARLANEAKESELELDATRQLFVSNLHGFDIGPLPIKKSDYLQSQLSRKPGLDIDESERSIDPHDQYVKTIATALESILQHDMHALSDAGVPRREIERREGQLRAQLILDFVHRLPYAKDIDHYAKPPVSTLYENGGDCEDLSVLTASLAEAMGIDACMAEVPGHIMPAFAIDADGGTIIDIKGQRYVLAESTGTQNTNTPTEFAVGDVAPKYQDSADVTAVLPNGERIKTRTKYIDAKTQRGALSASILFEDYEKPVALIRTSPADRVSRLELMLAGTDATIADDGSGTFSAAHLIDIPHNAADEHVTLRATYADGASKHISVPLERSFGGARPKKNGQLAPGAVLAYEPRRKALLITPVKGNTETLSIMLYRDGQLVRAYQPDEEGAIIEYPLDARINEEAIYGVIIEDIDGRASTSNFVPLARYDGRILVPREALLRRPTLYERGADMIKKNAEPIGVGLAGVLGLTLAAYMAKKAWDVWRKRRAHNAQPATAPAPRPRLPPGDLYTDRSSETPREPPADLWGERDA